MMKAHNLNDAVFERGDDSDLCGFQQIPVQREVMAVTSMLFVRPLQARTSARVKQDSEEMGNTVKVTCPLCETHSYLVSTSIRFGCLDTGTWNINLFIIFTSCWFYCGLIQGLSILWYLWCSFQFFFHPLIDALTFCSNTNLFDFWSTLMCVLLLCRHRWVRPGVQWWLCTRVQQHPRKLSLHLPRRIQFGTWRTQLPR